MTGSSRLRSRGRRMLRVDQRSHTAIRSQLARLRVGQVVHLTGLLVDGVRADGAYFHTSLNREDTGAGACEVMLVQEVEIR